MISIVTATYNRAYLLSRLYESLKEQKNRNFEWIIVDDGSRDNTSEVVEIFQQDLLLKINYLRKENGGKHTALNIGVNSANYDYIFFVDSDDILPEDSIQIIVEQINYIQSRSDYNSISGVCGLMTDFKGDLIGTKLTKNIVCSNIKYRYKYRVLGDKAEVFKKEVLLNYLFPIFSHEKFCPEALVWNRISEKYDMYFFNEIVYFREYLEGGLTDRIFEVRKNSPNSTLRYYKELFEKKEINCIIRIRALMNFWRFYYISDLNNYSGGMPSSFLNLLLRPLIKIYMKVLNQ